MKEERFLVCFSGKYETPSVNHPAQYFLRVGQKGRAHTIDWFTEYDLAKKSGKAYVDTVLQDLLANNLPAPLLTDLSHERDVKKVVLRRVRDSDPQCTVPQEVLAVSQAWKDQETIQAATKPKNEKEEEEEDDATSSEDGQSEGDDEKEDGEKEEEEDIPASCGGPLLDNDNLVEHDEKKAHILSKQEEGNELKKETTGTEEDVEDTQLTQTQTQELNFEDVAVKIEPKTPEWVQNLPTTCADKRTLSVDLAPPLPTPPRPMDSSHPPQQSPTTELDNREGDDEDEIDVVGGDEGEEDDGDFSLRLTETQTQTQTNSELTLSFDDEIFAPVSPPPPPPPVYSRAIVRTPQ